MVKSKTKTNRRQARKLSRRHFKESYEVTFFGLKKWYEHMFEQLGWMVLAKHHGMHDRITIYKHSLVRLENSLKHKIGEIHDEDRKHDLKIMLHNLQCLTNHVTKDFH